MSAYPDVNALEEVAKAVGKIAPAVKQLTRNLTLFCAVLCLACIFNTIHALVLGAQIKELQKVVATQLLNHPDK